MLIWREDFLLWLGMYSDLAGRYPALVWQEDILLWFGRKISYSGLAGMYSTLVWWEDILLCTGRKIPCSALAGRYNSHSSSVGGLGGGGVRVRVCGLTSVTCGITTLQLLLQKLKMLHDCCHLLGRLRGN